MTVYYQCDTSAYTKDEGGVPFLEFLYSYENGAKKFNRNDSLLEFSAEYKQKYTNLKGCINGY